MNIFAVVKKAINSNLNKPLNITLDEIKEMVSTPTIKRKVATATGIPYVKDNNAQVLTTSDTPILSVNGRGRILQIIPVSSNKADNGQTGTTLFSVDGEILLNNGVKFASSGIAGEYIVNQNVLLNYEYDYVNTLLFGTAIEFWVKASKTFVGGNNPAFNIGEFGIIEKDGIPFNQGFDIRMTQDSTNAPEKFGVIVVYELYE